LSYRNFLNMRNSSANAVRCPVAFWCIVLLE
jgi:hypothetical protein